MAFYLPLPNLNLATPKFTVVGVSTYNSDSGTGKTKENQEKIQKASGGFTHQFNTKYIISIQIFLSLTRKKSINVMGIAEWIVKALFKDNSIWIVKGIQAEVELVDSVSTDDEYVDVYIFRV